MDARIAHVAVNADDLTVTQRFYEGVFGWRFEEYAPGFVRTELSDGRTFCAIQQRRQLGAHPVHGMEVTFAVFDVRAVVAAVREHGGRVLMEPTAIGDVGEVVFVEDPSGNVFGAIAYNNDD
jgi:predicted enzyme related to lactoylglutathione lyase